VTHYEDAAQSFQAYTEAAVRAQTTLSLEDGIAAGRAWLAFLDAFQRETIVRERSGDGKVIYLEQVKHERAGS
jgi:hypothetical protein